MLNNIIDTSLNLKIVTVGKIWLQTIQINHKNKNFTIDFWNSYGSIYILELDKNLQI